MISKGIGLVSRNLILVGIVLCISLYFLFSNDNKKYDSCLDKAVLRINEIRCLPELKYLSTLDGKYVLLSNFYAKCEYLFPQCSLFRKFYYWRSEIKEVISVTDNGEVNHRIRCYHNCLSDFCAGRSDFGKTHGDVAEFYDGKGEFMGLAVYMGNGKYCSLPYDEYRKPRRGSDDYPQL